MLLWKVKKTMSERDIAREIFRPIYANTERRCEKCGDKLYKDEHKICQECIDGVEKWCEYGQKILGKQDWN